MPKGEAALSFLDSNKQAFAFIIQPCRKLNKNESLSDLFAMSHFQRCCCLVLSSTTKQRNPIRLGCSQERLAGARMDRKDEREERVPDPDI